MSYWSLPRAFACVVFLTCCSAFGQMTVTVDHNDADHATAEFKFAKVPSPAKHSAAKFSIVAGDRDDAGGDLEVLTDGKLPTEADQPAANFFFAAGSEGGRLLADLGSPTNVKAVNTYSWHTDSRAPQVYKLYAAIGTEAGFKSAPAQGINPTTAGYKLIATVDSHPKTGEPGGQYGVSIADPKGSVGDYRYFLFDISRTESDDDFGNTFFSEISIVADTKDAGGKELVGAPKPEGDQPGVKTVQMENGKYTATIDTTETPDLTEWADKELAPVVIEWYPKLVKMLPSPNYDAPTHFSITFRANKPGVADTGGTRINCSGQWMAGELKGQAKGAIVHEMVHVVQQYGLARRTNRHPNPSPGWLTEGIPDYIRWYYFEPKSGGANITKRGFPKANYDGSYRITANFLHYVVDKYDKDLIEKLNAAMRQGNYSDDLWTKSTGKTVQDLNTEWKADVAKGLGLPAN